MISLPPGAERALLRREILGLEADPGSGWIEIDSNRTGLGVFLATGGYGFLHTAEPADTPVSVVAAIGTHDGSLLEQVPASPAP